MNRYPVLLMIIILTISSCHPKLQKTASVKNNNTNNPLLKPSTLPFQTIDFDRLKDKDFEPALNLGMEEKLKEVEQIANNPDAPTFENTLVALERSGELLRRAENAFGLITSANTDDYLQELQEKLAPKMAATSDAVILNERLFNRIKSIYTKRDELALDGESKRLVEHYYQQFVLNGALLSPSDKSTLKKMNEEEASLSVKFNNQLLAAAKKGALIVSDQKLLEGLSSGDIDAAAHTAQDNGLHNQWMIPLQNTTQQPDLQFLKIRDTRYQLFQNSWNRAEKNDSNDTRKTILRIAALRAQKAALLGFKNYAEWNLQDQMAKTPEAVERFFQQLVPAATAKAKSEAADIQKVINNQNGGFELQPWDWNYYAEEVRKNRYNLNESEIKPYFELNKVLEDGVFYAANQLYGITFKERKDLPVYHPDVRVFEVDEQNGNPIGLFYTDYFKRDNKNGGAWMSNIVDQSKLLGTKPVVYNVCNFTKPAPGQPALISFDDVTTMFHEFGHALHGLFADQMYPSLSGTSVARDFVEFPSQFNENWALYPTILKNYAVHYKTGQPIPQELVDKIKRSSTFNQGYALTELLAAANLDMQWHEITASQTINDVDSFETAALKKTHLDLPQVPPRYRSSYFLHIWSNGYAAGYYAYSWTEMLDHDAFSWFMENGGLTRENGERFRRMILSKGNTEDLSELYRNFRGKDPEMKPMLISRGLIDTK